jgi:hydrogenase maturation protease
MQVTRDVLVLGLGNTLLADDGVGVHVIRRLADEHVAPAGLSMVDGGTLGFRLMAVITEFDYVIIVDAAQLGEQPGSVRLLDRQTLAHHVRSGERMSAHEAGLVDLLTLARLEGWSPLRLALLGIQPQFVDWGQRLSPPVSRSLPVACRAVIRTARAWQAAA